MDNELDDEKHDGMLKIDAPLSLLDESFLMSGSITPTTTGKVEFIAIDDNELKKIHNYLVNKLQQTKNHWNTALYTKLNGLKDVEKEASNLKSFDQHLQAVFELPSKLEKEQQQFRNNISKELKNTVLKIQGVEKEVQLLKNFITSLDAIKDDNLMLEQENVIFKRIYQENFNGNVREDTPYVTHYGISAKTLSVLSGFVLTKYELHPIEDLLLLEALSLLLSTPSTKDVIKFRYKQNIVLVDIFARDNNTIKIDADRMMLPETHTIVLWKKGVDEIVIIDPSKGSFSNWLSDIIRDKIAVIQVGQGKGEVINIKCLFDNNDIFYSSGGKKTGYSKYDDKDPLPRDCIDIAVKIAFEIQEQQKKGINLENLEKELLKMSNNVDTNPIFDEIDKKVSKKFQSAFLRGLQSSSATVRTAVKACWDWFLIK